MNILTRLFVALALLTSASACGPKLGTAQLGVDELDAFPQNNPYATLRSVSQAIKAKKFAYLVAHLADQSALDKMTRAEVDRAVRDTKTRFSGGGDEQGAPLLAQLEVALRKCQLVCPPSGGSDCMQRKGDKAECSLSSGGKLSFVRRDGRWFMMD